MALAPEELPSGPSLDALVARHVRVGFGALFVFATLGVGLEALHAFKSPWYLDVGQETRRLMWTLAHAHGVGLGLVNVAYAAALRVFFGAASRAHALASALLAAATLLLPLGFALGGVVTYGGDPGPAVVLVPLGALSLWLALALIAREALRPRRGP
jgi:hypothetical protein